MVDAPLRDRMFQRIMRGLVNTGRAPHYGELARALGLGVEEGRLLLHDVMRAYPIGWLHPETDYIVSFPPLNGAVSNSDATRALDPRESLAAHASLVDLPKSHDLPRSGGRSATVSLEAIIPPGHPAGVTRDHLDPRAPEHDRWPPAP